MATLDAIIAAGVAILSFITQERLIGYQKEILRRQIAAEEDQERFRIESRRQSFPEIASAEMSTEPQQQSGFQLLREGAAIMLYDTWQYVSQWQQLCWILPMIGMCMLGFAIFSSCKRRSKQGRPS